MIHVLRKSSHVLGCCGSLRSLDSPDHRGIELANRVVDGRCEYQQVSDRWLNISFRMDEDMASYNEEEWSRWLQHHFVGKDSRFKVVGDDVDVSNVERWEFGY